MHLLADPHMPDGVFENQVGLCPSSARQQRIHGAKQGCEVLIASALPDPLGLIHLTLGAALLVRPGDVPHADYLMESGEDLQVGVAELIGKEDQYG